MVIGQYSSHVGVGNRVTFPKKFSKELGRILLITKGLDNNLIMVPAGQKQLLLEDITIKPYVTAAVREMQAFVLGNTFEIELDRLNRFVIPQQLVDFAGVKNEVVFVGMEAFVQVWASKRWEAYQHQIQQTIDQSIEKLSGNE